jgi:hypothetical protein
MFWDPQRGVQENGAVVTLKKSWKSNLHSTDHEYGAAAKKRVVVMLCLVVGSFSLQSENSIKGLRSTPVSSLATIFPLQMSYYFFFIYS